LLAALQNPIVDGRPAIQGVTGWALDSLNALLQRFFGGFAPTLLSAVENLRRVYDAFAIIKTSRISVSDLIAAATNAPSALTMGALQPALRVHYAERDWPALVRPINGTMRIRQRDALVAYILQQFNLAYEQSLVRSATTADADAGSTELVIAPLDLGKVKQGMHVKGANMAVYTTVVGITESSVVIKPELLARLPTGSNVTFVPADVPDIDTPEKLFEILLMDVETQPPVETSRIRLALSSVQLFIERVLRNLEPNLSDS
jgi:hypothetical protein